MKRNSTAVWHGTGKEGSGHITTASGVLKETQYSFKTRFEDGIGTNPEELVAAAHAGCFTMKLSFLITGAGFTPGTIETTCEINFENGAVTGSHLKVKAKVEGIDNEKFQELVTEAEKTCPISKLLNTAITSEATLEA